MDTSAAKVNHATHIIDQFPLKDAMISLLASAYLTDATGALRAKAFLRSFVLG